MPNTKERQERPSFDAKLVRTSEIFMRNLWSKLSETKQDEESSHLITFIHPVKIDFDYLTMPASDSITGWVLFLLVPRARFTVGQGILRDEAYLPAIFSMQNWLKIGA